MRNKFRNKKIQENKIIPKSNFTSCNKLDLRSEGIWHVCHKIKIFLIFNFVQIFAHFYFNLLSSNGVFHLTLWCGSLKVAISISCTRCHLKGPMHYNGFSLFEKIPFAILAGNGMLWNAYRGWTGKYKDPNYWAIHLKTEKAFSKGHT